MQIYLDVRHAVRTLLSGQHNCTYCIPQLVGMEVFYYTYYREGSSRYIDHFANCITRVPDTHTLYHSFIYNIFAHSIGREIYPAGNQRQIV